jgi:hypothetical protein
LKQKEYPPLAYYIFDGDGNLLETNCPKIPEHVEIQKEASVVKPPPKPKRYFKKLSCMRCNYSWSPRKYQKPIQCPKCKSPYWNRERAKH